MVPGKLAYEITQRTSLFTISLGSGSKCDAQYLFSADILGEKNDFLPRHAKRYKTLFKELEKIQFDRVKAFGCRLNIPSGTAVRFEPGQIKIVNLIPFKGNRKIYGFNAKVMGDLDV